MREQDTTSSWGKTKLTQREQDTTLIRVITEIRLETSLGSEGLTLGKRNSKGKTSIGETQADSWEEATGNSTEEAPKN